MSGQGRAGLVEALRALAGEFAEDALRALQNALDRAPGGPAARALHAWEARAAPGAAGARAEFARQAACAGLVRMLLARAGAGAGLDAAGATRRLAGRHFGAERVFDWLRIRPAAARRAEGVLAALGAGATRLDADVLGPAFAERAGAARHAEGRHYTPRPLVEAMLDRAGYRGDATAGRRLADLACGSGGFLVAACGRLLARHRDRRGHVPAARAGPALREVESALWGFDVDPFACFLAEVNLLLQVIPLLQSARRAGVPLAPAGFSIQCADALLAPDAAFSGVFDFLVGNPPYVRADEGAPGHLAYRRAVEAQPWFTTRHRKWDLYVPFVERHARLLSDDPRARACLVTIASVATAPYAAKLRALLARGATMHEILFLEGLRLFPDAPWQDDIVVCFSRGAPPPGHAVRRGALRGPDAAGALRINNWGSGSPDGALRPKLRVDNWGSGSPDGALRPKPRFEPLEAVVQAGAPPDAPFRRRAAAALDLEGTVRWDELCYVTKGMVLHASERLADGGAVLVPASYDPARFGEALVEDLGPAGKRVRHRRFGRQDLVADAPDAVHTRPFVGSREVLRGGLGPARFLEWGPHTRCPARISRPTFPELYDRPKILFGTFTGVAVDDGAPAGFLAASDSVRLAVRWALLEGVERRALEGARRALARRGGFRPGLSAGLSDWYLAAIAASAPIQRWLHANRRSMKDHVYPDDIKAIPVKLLPPAAQRPFVERARARHRLYAELARAAPGAAPALRARIRAESDAIDALAEALYGRAPVTPSGRPGRPGRASPGASPCGAGPWPASDRRRRSP